MGITQSLQADPIREIDQAELRAIVAAGNSLSLSKLIIEKRSELGGQPVDVRVFDAGVVYYRVLVKQDDGRLASVTINSTSGELLSSDSQIAYQVSLAANARNTVPQTQTGSP